MLAKIKEFVKNYQSDIMIFIIVVLLSLLSFALGFILAKKSDLRKEPLKIEYQNQLKEDEKK
jgi:hypothetical protein